MAQELRIPGEVNIGDNATPSSPRTLIKRFRVLQEERVQTYQLFEEGFQAYLNGSPNYNFRLYRQLVHEITETFNKISQDIIAIKHKLECEHSRIPLAVLIGKIQEAEQNKLEKTAKLQLTRQNIKDHPTEAEHKAEEITLKQSLKELVEHIIEYMEEIKYESEDLFTDDDDDDDDDDNDNESSEGREGTDIIPVER